MNATEANFHVLFLSLILSHYMVADNSEVMNLLAFWLQSFLQGVLMSNTFYVTCFPLSEMSQGLLSRSVFLLF